MLCVYMCPRKINMFDVAKILIFPDIQTFRTKEEFFFFFPVRQGVANLPSSSLRRALVTKPKEVYALYAAELFLIRYILIFYTIEILMFFAIQSKNIEKES